MAADTQWNVLPSDRARLRELAARVRGIAESEANVALRNRWTSHNDLGGGGPMILAETGGLRQSGELSFEAQSRCHEKWARTIEGTLLGQLFQAEQVRDDSVVDPHFNVNWRVSAGDFGVKIERHSGSTPGHMGSYVWEPPIKDLARDLEKLRPRTFTVDRESTIAWRDHLADVFGDILPVRIRGNFWWTTGLTWTAIDLVGLEGLMLAMHDEPAGLHRLMAFLRDDILRFARWLEQENLLTLNNETDHIGSGSLGFSSQLPKPGGNGRVRMADLWVLSESQETVGVGPDMFAEFVFAYQKPIIDSFGLCYYGCCEPVHQRFHVIRQASNLRKVSVSPWCDQAAMAEMVGREVIFCRKPNPAMISAATMNEDLIREDLRTTFQTAGRCHLEVVMKDVHTLSGQLGRLGRWVEMAREASRQARLPYPE